jgi:hypothetical protein
MNVKILAMASAGLALVAAPVMASAAPASPAANLSVAKSVRTGSSTVMKSKAAEGGIIVAVLSAVAVAGGVYLVVDNDDDDSDSN